MESKTEFAQAQRISETDEATEVENVLEPLHTDDEQRQVLEQLYATLQPWETRLIALHPGQFDDPLVADLQTSVITFEEGFGLVDERRSVQYEALSYTWGGEILSHPLICNGLTTGITRNLSIALQYLRLADDVRYLWVDAICINQTDNIEKSKQIRNLRLVFGHARQVVAWVDEESQSTHLVVEALKLVGAELDYKPGQSRNIRAPSVRLSLFNSSEDKLTARNALLDFLGRPWFSRAWIVQEVCAAKVVSMQCGRFLIDWNVLSTIILDSRSGKPTRSIARELIFAALGIPESENYMKGATGVFELTAIEFLMQNRRTQHCRKAKNQVDAVEDLYNLLRSAAHLNATDPRDKIWALVGLTDLPILYGSDGSSENRGDMPCIDYAKPVVQVFAELTKFFLISFGYPMSLLLPYCHRYELPSSAPSWRLDFEEMKFPWHLSRNHPLAELFGRVSNARDQEEVAAAISSNTAWNLLTLEGWHIGTICDPLQVSAGHWGRNATVSQSGDDPHDLRDRCPDCTPFPHWKKTVRNTPCLHEWLLNEAGSSVKWDDASLSLLDFVGENSGSLRHKAKVDVRRLIHKNAKFVSQTSIEAYVNFRAENQWCVHESVQNGDIVVHFSLCEKAYVLRQTDLGQFKCLGNTTPLRNILVRSETDSVESPAHGYPVPKRDSPNKSKYKQLFHIC